jgi:hypothetical protein
VFPFDFTFKTLLLLFSLQATLAKAETQVAEAFPGTMIDPDLLPLMEEFLSLSQKAQITLPLTKAVSRITIV